MPGRTARWQASSSSATPLRNLNRKTRKIANRTIDSRQTIDTMTSSKQLPTPNKDRHGKDCSHCRCTRHALQLQQAAGGRMHHVLGGRQHRDDLLVGKNDFLSDRIADHTPRGLRKQASCFSGMAQAAAANAYRAYTFTNANRSLQEEAICPHDKGKGNARYTPFNSRNACAHRQCDTRRAGRHSRCRRPSSSAMPPRLSASAAF